MDLAFQLMTQKIQDEIYESGYLLLQQAAL